MMKVNYCTRLLMFLAVILFYNNAAAQGIRGDTIFLEINKAVTVKFPSDLNYKLLPNSEGQEGLYSVNPIGNNAISILALKKEAKEQYLEVTEKDRKHLFILSYKEGNPARMVDISTMRKLKKYATDVNKKVSKLLSETDVLYDQVKNNTSDQVLWKNLEDRYQSLLLLVDDNKVDDVKSRLEESRKVLKDIKGKNYGEVMKQAKNNFSLKKYPDAKSFLVKALEYNPGDIEALKYISLTDSLWSKDYEDQGDEARKTGNPVLAKTNYQKALDITPNNPSLQEKFNQVKESANNIIYKTGKEKGDQAWKANDIVEARRAYESALSVYPNDRYIKSQLNKVIVEENKIELEQKNDTAYQVILAKAKILADKASNQQEYDLAIKEYERALSAIPDRKYPRKKIAELTKIKKSIRQN